MPQVPARMRVMTTLIAPATSDCPLLRTSPPDFLMIMLNARLVAYIHISSEL